MRLRLRTWWPAILGWPVFGACAFIGALLSSDQRITGAIWTTMSFLALVATVLMYLRMLDRARRARKQLEREVGIETRALAVGVRARTVRFMAIGRDGSLRSCSMLELLEETPEGGVLGWDDPYHVRVYYHPFTTDTGESDGEPV